MTTHCTWSKVAWRSLESESRATLTMVVSSTDMIDPSTTTPPRTTMARSRTAGGEPEPGAPGGGVGASLIATYGIGDADQPIGRLVRAPARGRPTRPDWPSIDRGGAAGRRRIRHRGRDCP